ncbi:hypothetical protein F4780DRAFT_357041 [Xylariomycetidae sp. FL0641]|nr:hypothetical protein F4780DRAFT_357041 [Xylariomycetidae sp. FL0641]
MGTKPWALRSLTWPQLGFLGLWDRLATPVKFATNGAANQHMDWSAANQTCQAPPPQPRPDLALQISKRTNDRRKRPAILVADLCHHALTLVTETLIKQEIGTIGWILRYQPHTPSSTPLVFLATWKLAWSSGALRRRQLVLRTPWRVVLLCPRTLRYDSGDRTNEPLM